MTILKNFLVQTNNITPREDSVISSKDSYYELKFDVTQNKIIRFANGTDMCFFNLRTGALIAEWELTSCEKQVENLEHSHYKCLL